MKKVDIPYTKSNHRKNMHYVPSFAEAGEVHAMDITDSIKMIFSEQTVFT